MSFTSSLGLFGLAARLWAAHGLDAATLAALLGGAGTFIIGCVQASREIRAWLDRSPGKVRRAKADPDAPPCPASPLVCNDRAAAGQAGR